MAYQPSNQAVALTRATRTLDLLRCDTPTRHQLPQHCRSRLLTNVRRPTSRTILYAQKRARTAFAWTAQQHCLPADEIPGQMAASNQGLEGIWEQAPGFSPWRLYADDRWRWGSRNRTTMRASPTDRQGLNVGNTALAAGLNTYNGAQSLDPGSDPRRWVRAGALTMDNLMKAQQQYQPGAADDPWPDPGHGCGQSGAEHWLRSAARPLQPDRSAAGR